MNDQEVKKELKKWLIAFINNISLFTLTFFFAYIAYNTAILITAKFTGLDIAISNYSVKANSMIGNISHVILVFLSGPITLLALGIIALTFFNKLKKKRGIMKIFFLWFYLNCFNMLLGNFIIGILTDSGFGEIAWRMHFSDIFKIVLIFISLIGIVLIGNSNSKYFYTTSFSRSFIETRKKRVLFLLFIVIFPCLIGGLIFTIVNLSIGSFYQRAIFVTLFLLIVPAFRNKASFNHIRVMKESTAPTIVWGWVFVLIVVIIGYKIAILYGLNQ